MNAINNLIINHFPYSQTNCKNVPLNFYGLKTHFRVLFSPPTMASSSSSSTGSLKHSYERLKQEISFEDDDFGLGEKVIGRYLRSSSLHRFFRMVHVRRRLKVKIPSSRRFLSRKARVLMAAWLKMYRRLKDGRAHFGDIFAGNHLFMQVIAP